MLVLRKRIFFFIQISQKRLLKSVKTFFGKRRSKIIKLKTMYRLTENKPFATPNLNLLLKNRLDFSTLQNFSY